MGKKHPAIKTVEKADKAVTRKAAEYREKPAVKALGLFGDLGDQPPMVALCLATTAAGLVRRDPRLTRAGLRMLASHALATGLKAILKRSIDRTRPDLLIDDDHYETGKGERNEGDYNSFPSGHTAGAVAVARAFARDYPEFAVPAYVGAATIAGIQIPRCHHFVSDITVGAAIGAASEAVVSGAERLWRRSSADPR